MTVLGCWEVGFSLFISILDKGKGEPELMETDTIETHPCCGTEENLLSEIQSFINLWGLCLECSLVREKVPRKQGLSSSS